MGMTKSSSNKLSEDDIEKTLLEKGVISEIPARELDFEEEVYEPFEVIGKPFSETILEDRNT